MILIDLLRLQTILPRREFSNATPPMRGLLAGQNRRPLNVSGHNAEKAYLATAAYLHSSNKILFLALMILTCYKSWENRRELNAECKPDANWEMDLIEQPIREVAWGKGEKRTSKYSPRRSEDSMCNDTH